MPKRFLRTRILLGMGTAAVIAVAAVGCSASSPQDGSSPSEDESGPVTLRMAIEATPAVGTVADLAEQYSEENPNVKFVIDRVPNDQYGEVLRTQLQGGNAPDLFHLIGGSGTPTSALPLAEAGYLTPLTDTVADELFTDSNRSLAEYDGEIWAQPVQFVALVLNFNASAAEELGIDLDFGSVDKLIDACPTATDAGKSLLILAGGTAQNNAGTALQFAATRVYAENPEWNQDRAAGEVTFQDTPGWKESLELFETLKDAGCFQPGVEAGALEANFPAVAGGTSLGSFSPGSAVAAMKATSPDSSFLSTAFPGDKEGDVAVFGATNMLGLNAASSDENKAAALKFLDWLAEPEHADQLAAASGNISIRAEAGDPMQEQYELLSPTYDPDIFYVTPSLTFSNPSVYVTLGTGIQGILTGQATPDQVLAQLDAAWDAPQ